MYTDAYISIKSFFTKIGRDKLYLYSATAAFFMVLSVFPFAILLLTIIQFTPLTEEFLVEQLQIFLPDAIYPFFEGMISEVFETERGVTWILASGIGALWSASRGILSLIRGINVCFNVDDKRNYFVVRMWSAFYTFVAIIAIVFLLVTVVFGTTIYNAAEPYLRNSNILVRLLLQNRFLVSLVLITLLFMVMYKFLPAKTNHFLRMFPGSLLAAAALTAVSSLLSVYIDRVPNFTLTYGSLTSMIIVMLWLYIGMYIIFVCGEINFFVNMLFDNLHVKRMRNKALKYEMKQADKQQKQQDKEITRTLKLNQKELKKKKRSRGYEEETFLTSTGKNEISESERDDFDDFDDFDDEASFNVHDVKRKR